jgi:hypothetical protein
VGGTKKKGLKKKEDRHKTPEMILLCVPLGQKVV